MAWVARAKAGFVAVSAGLREQGLGHLDTRGRRKPSGHTPKHRLASAMAAVSTLPAPTPNPKS